MSDDPYRRVARIYDRLFEPANRNLRELGMRLYPPGEEARVLDVGCGTGVHLDLYRKAGCKPYGIDASAAMLDVARERLGERADLRLGDATRMPYTEASFDLILCMLVLHEMEQEMRLAVLAEMQRVLAPGGRILLIDYHAGPARPLKGWLMKLFILLAEVAAGRRHFHNYLHFMSLGGVPALIAGSRLAEEQRKVVAGGTLVLHVLCDAGYPVPPEAVQ
ncbi:MAG: class I SAM-dependent methyltransferase [Gammaproteobacteria bacterium]|jgi:ubiquinone/menaquinone biosynthesis C-methylase UbiE